jgi:hypothetical protein
MVWMVIDLIFVLIAVVIFVHQLLISFLLWSQYRYVETLQEPAHVLLEDNSTLRHSDSNSITTENDLVHKGNQLKFEKMRKTMNLFGRSSFTITCILLVHCFVIRRLTKFDLKLSSEIPPNPAVYILNEDLLALNFLFTTTRILGIYSVWLPMKPEIF